MKSNVAYSYSDTLNSLDRSIIQSVQDYVNEYRKHNGMYPASLSVLLIFLKKYNVERLPELSFGKIIYDPVTGMVKAGKRYDEAATAATDSSYTPPSANPSAPVLNVVPGTKENGKSEKPVTNEQEKKQDVFRIE